MKEEVKSARLAALEELTAEVSNTTKGRKTLVESGKEERVPFTTSITRQNREKLGVYSAKKGQRIADILDDILNGFFADK